MRKAELMKELIDRYEQREHVYPACSQMIVDNHIQKLENELISEIMMSRKGKRVIHDMRGSDDE